VLPANLPRQLVGADSAAAGIENVLSPPGALVAMLAYAVVPLAVAAVLIHRRDA
jgi:hypothetical protein